MRHYIRHPSDVPIRFSLRDVATRKDDHLKDISQGGLCFCAHFAVAKGAIIQIEIPVDEPTFEAEGTVMWCRPVDEESFEIGVQFADAAAEFNLRMVEQVCYIEQYKKDILLKEGRELSGEEAAVEWIAKHAAKFPR